MQVPSPGDAALYSWAACFRRSRQQRRPVAAEGCYPVALVPVDVRSMSASNRPLVPGFAGWR